MRHLIYAAVFAAALMTATVAPAQNATGPTPPLNLNGTPLVLQQPWVPNGDGTYSPSVAFAATPGVTPYTVTFNSIYSTRSGFTLGSSAYQYTTVRFVNFNGTWHQSSPEVVSY